MVAFNKFQPFVEALAEKLHNLGSDQMKLALCAAANAPVAANGVLADLTEIAYTNLSAREVTTTSSAQTGGIYKLTLTDLTLTASGGAVATWRYVVLYNDTALNDELIGFFDNGSDVTLADGESRLINFDDAGGVLTIQ